MSKLFPKTITHLPTVDACFMKGEGGKRICKCCWHAPPTPVAVLLLPLLSSPERVRGDFCTPRKRKRGIGCGRGVFAKKMEMRMDRDVVRAELGGKASHVIGARTRAQYSAIQWATSTLFIECGG
ncbi:hypothetical protein NPIL_493911 [Nephila pilipes]|uniref:Uncharacterized protein n=1 Tax=Nephila pilipes TaxID=299642 RepID=A0A8X6Q3C3_NEPPI|nr:hypothetical protein NPIL_493911 [Nephila pilipes]